MDETDALTLDWLLGIQKIEGELHQEAREKQEAQMKRQAASQRGRRSSARPMRM